MRRALDPIPVLRIAVAGWMNQHHLLAIDYLREENRILREQLGGRRLRFTDDQRRRLATKAKGLGRKLLVEIATIVTLNCGTPKSGQSRPAAYDYLASTPESTREVRVGFSDHTP